MGDGKRVLILGGTGFVARHLVKYLIDNKLASKIRVVDKKLPQTSYLSDEFKKYYGDKLVEHKQANLSNEIHVKKAFKDEEGKYDWVINLAAETRFGQDEGVYKQMVHKLSVNCAKEATTHGCEKYIEVSTSQVYKSGKKPSDEKATLKPWTNLAKYKLLAENDIKEMKGLNWIIARPATIYGPGDINGLMPRIICGATYTKTKDKMKLLWSGDLKINSIHVEDVAAGLVFLCQKGKVGEIYNMVDGMDLDQDKMNKILSSMFGMKTGYFGKILSNVAKLKMKEAVETANENHMNPWSDMCKESKIQFTPLSPYLDKELLFNNPLAVNGKKLRELGFKYKHDKVTESELTKSVKYYQDLNLFPSYKKI